MAATPESPAARARPPQGGRALTFPRQGEGLAPRARAHSPRVLAHGSRLKRALTCSTGSPGLTCSTGSPESGRRTMVPPLASLSPFTLPPQTQDPPQPRHPAAHTTRLSHRRLTHALAHLRLDSLTPWRHPRLGSLAPWLTRTLAHSHLGSLAPWLTRALAHSRLGALAPWRRPRWLTCALAPSGTARDPRLVGLWGSYPRWGGGT